MSNRVAAHYAGAGHAGIVGNNAADLGGLCRRKPKSRLCPFERVCNDRWKRSSTVVVDRPDEGFGRDELVTALERGELVAHFQPKLDLREASLSGVEALVRWQHPRLGLVGPDRFIDAIKRHGLLPQLTSTVLAQSCTQVLAWRRAGRNLQVAINVEWPSVEDGSLLSELNQTVAAFGLVPECLQVELSEQSPIRDKAAALMQIQAIRKAGYSVAIDDFGMENASLQLLRELECDVVKLDRSLVRGIDRHPRAAMMLAGLVRLATSLGAEIVAEGVETEDELGCLLESGCHQMQGFLFSPALSGAELNRRYC
ncbi:hypothetical protein BJP62_00510 [Jeongeupia sp. USM3]|nr:hypothetical protein BJP62_00510 [Jeongeupia sp. USM3]